MNIHVRMQESTKASRGGSAARGAHHISDIWHLGHDFHGGALMRKHAIDVEVLVEQSDALLCSQALPCCNHFSEGTIQQHELAVELIIGLVVCDGYPCCNDACSFCFICFGHHEHDLELHTTILSDSTLQGQQGDP